MRVRINIDFELSPRVKRGLLIAAPIAVLAAASVAYANVPNTFKDGDTLSAQAMNDNMSSLDTRVAAVESRISAKSTATYKLGATYCGLTGTTQGDLSGIAGTGTGYAKTRAQCQAACAGAASAHMCTADEIVRSASLGITVGSGWYASGVSREYQAAEGYECFGWTTKDATRIGAVWAGDVNRPSSAICSASSPVLCCD